MTHKQNSYPIDFYTFIFCTWEDIGVLYASNSHLPVHTEDQQDMNTSVNNQATVKADASTLASQEISGEVLVEKYAKGNEKSVAEVRQRVARALASIETEDKRAHWEAKFLEAQEKGFIPAGRINSAAGTNLQATLINCFVQPVGDSVTESVDGRPASTPPSPRPPRPCAAAAAWATTSPASAPRAARW